MTSFVAAPFELMKAVGDSVRALAELPATLERSLRDTNALIAEARTQLALLSEQLDKMVVVTDRLVETTSAIAAVAEGAQRQMAATGEQLAAANRSLEHIVRLAEPLDRMGKRVAEGLLRVTGRATPHDASE
jgi:hypothetical protein